MGKPAARVPDLRIQLRRTRDGTAALTCTRADGSVTWQRQAGSLGLVFPSHDLTHYAVETTLGYRHGFFGLVADGWEITDFSHPWPKGAIPDEAREVELIVAIFEMERRMGGWMADEFQEQAAIYATSGKGGHRSAKVPPLTDAQLDGVRAVRDDVLSRWDATGLGDALELDFKRAG